MTLIWRETHLTSDNVIGGELYFRCRFADDFHSLISSLFSFSLSVVPRDIALVSAVSRCIESVLHLSMSSLKFIFSVSLHKKSKFQRLLGKRCYKIEKCMKALTDLCRTVIHFDLNAGLTESSLRWQWTNGSTESFLKESKRCLLCDRTFWSAWGRSADPSPAITRPVIKRALCLSLNCKRK